MALAVALMVFLCVRSHGLYPDAHVDWRSGISRKVSFGQGLWQWRLPRRCPIPQTAPILYKAMMELICQSGE